MLLVVGLVAYTLVFAEIFIRTLAPQVLVPRYVTGTPWGVRGNIPNAHYWHHTPEVNVQYRINSQGMRADHDYPLQKPAGMCRIALFGDSFFVGYELDLKDTFAARVENELRADGINVELLNFSVSGFGTAEMLRVYEGYARQFDPDVVIFEWHGTDPDDNVRSGLYALRDGKIARSADVYLPGIALQDVLMKSSVYRYVADNSHLYSFVREAAATFVKEALVTIHNALTAKRARQQKHDEELEEDADGSGESGSGGGGLMQVSLQQTADLQPPAPAKKYGYDIRLSAALLEHAQTLVRAENRDFYVVEIPRRISRRRFRSAADLLPPETRAVLPIISPMTEFARVAGLHTKLYYEKGHGHLSPLGSELLSHEAAQKLRNSPAFARCSEPAPPISEGSTRR